MSLLLSNDRYEQLRGQVPALNELSGERAVLVSGMMYVNPFDGLDADRFKAALDTLSSSRDAGIPHVVMLDHRTHPQAAKEIAARTDLVVPVEEDEGGLARPYVTAAKLLVPILPENAVMVKTEGEKNLAQNIYAFRAFVRSAANFDVTVGRRTESTWLSMPRYLALTESMLSLAISQIAGVPEDTPSGVLAIKASSLPMFWAVTKKNDWGYLIELPLRCTLEQGRVGSVEIDFSYHQAVVGGENLSREMDAKRRNQMRLMLDRAVQVAGGRNQLDDFQLQVLIRAEVMLRSLNLIAGEPGDEER